MVLHNIAIRVLVFFQVLVRICNTPHSVKRYVIDPKAFLRYWTKVLPFNSILLAMGNTLLIVEAKNDLIHGILQIMPIKVIISFLVFVKVLQ
jgi:hypothetical protein